MKAESNIMPVVRFEILPLNDDEVEVLFYENIEIIPPTSEDETEKYSFDYYRLIIRNREKLETVIEASYDAWLALAKEKELKELAQVPTPSDRITVLEETINYILGI